MKIKRSLTSTLNKSTNQLRLILGDQLNIKHSWFKEKNPKIVYLIAELNQELGYTTHHVQKVCAFFAAMEQFAHQLATEGHQILYLTLDDTTQYSTLNELLLAVIKHHNIEYFGYQQPDEYRLASQMSEFRAKSITVDCYESEHFLLKFHEIKQEFKANKPSKMEFFYRRMRKRFNILMDEEQPLGGAWNFDSKNRFSFKAQDLKDIPQPHLFNNKVDHILKRLEQHNVDTIGQSVDELLWPINREQSLILLDYFCRFLLPQFGKYQDAMTEKSDYQWSLYHSRLSFSLNSKMVSPLEVIHTSIHHWEQNQKDISLPQIEGFVRQILGWREYIRGIYWVNMPDYGTHNYLAAKRKLPDFFWNANTKMNCLHQAISQSLKYAYAHHIQRLMITGNFCLLAGIDPNEVDQWYLGIYIDAIEWVEMPNTRGMTQHADHGLVATKPYAASGSYVNKMSDYCKGCHYNVKLKTEDNACPLNSLYWHFIDRHSDKFRNNMRMKMVYSSWNKMDKNKRNALLKKASTLLNNIEML